MKVSKQTRYNASGRIKSRYAFLDAFAASMGLRRMRSNIPTITGVDDTAFQVAIDSGGAFFLRRRAPLVREGEGV